MSWADEVKIETPELVEVSLEIAGLGSRFVAQLIDWLVKFGILVVVICLAIICVALLGGNERTVTGSLLIQALIAGFLWTFLLGFDIYYELRHNGQTPGKRIAGIRVLRDGGAPLDFQSAMIRNLLALADFLPIFYFFGALLILITPRGQRLGDLAAGTIVVRERAARPPTDLREEIERLASSDIAFTPEQLAACTLSDRHVLRSFFQRYGEMDAEARDLLARRLANTFLDKLACDLPYLLRAESFLASLCRDLETFRR